MEIVVTTLAQAIAQGFRRYIDFRGRASRAEYWWWWLFALAGGALSYLIGIVVQWRVPEVVFVVVMFLPTSAITTRRLHDIGKTGWWKAAWLALGVISGALAFISNEVGPGTLGSVVPGVASGLVAAAGGIWAVAWLVRQGDTGPNRFGPDPQVVNPRRRGL